MKYVPTIKTFSCGKIENIKNHVEELLKFSLFLAYEDSNADVLLTAERIFGYVKRENSYTGTLEEINFPEDKFGCSFNGKIRSFDYFFREFTNVPMSGWRLSYVKTLTKNLSCTYKYVLTHPTDDNINMTISQFDELIPFLSITNGVINDRLCFYYNKGNLCATMEGTNEFEFLYLIANNESTELKQLEQGDTYISENKHHSECVYLGEYFIAINANDNNFEKPYKKHLISYLNTQSNTYFIKAISNLKGVVRTGSIDCIRTLSIPHTIIGNTIDTENEYLSLYNGAKLPSISNMHKQNIFLSKTKDIESFLSIAKTYGYIPSNRDNFETTSIYSYFDLFYKEEVFLNE